jgi:hypothetical protein
VVGELARALRVGGALPPVGFGIAGEIAFAVDEDHRDVALEDLLDQVERERGLAAPRAAEHAGVAKQRAELDRAHAAADAGGPAEEELGVELVRGGDDRRW